MATDTNSILAITQPTLEIKRISYTDVEALNNQVGAQSGTTINQTSVKASAGLVAPLIEIDNYQVPIGNIVSLDINQTGFLPELSLSFIDETGAFSGMYFPRTNPIIKVYIKALNPTLKPIRADFLITNIVGSELGNTYTNGRVQTMYTISGSLYIPGMYGNVILSIPKKKSWEALKWIADYLKLGFATNETSTNDEMTWLNPNNGVDSFIKSICERAYKDEKSFFGCFIDVNYILHFINYEKALSKETKPLTSPGHSDLAQHLDITGLNEGTTQDSKPKDYNESPILLTSSIKRASTGFHITNYEMTSNHGEILSLQSYKKSILWHDRKYYLENKAVIEHYVEPISDKTIDSKFTTYQKPQLKSFIDKDHTARWVGIDYNNGHPNYKFSKLLNLHNLDEFNKNYLTVVIPGVNQSIIRGAKILVEIAKLVAADNTANIPDENFGPQHRAKTGQVEELDLYLSGPYVVKQVKYVYNSFASTSELRYSTELILVRREWVEIAEANKLNSEKTTTTNV
jgi:hypothetical protein